MPSREVLASRLTPPRKEPTLTYTATAMHASSLLAVLAASALVATDAKADPIVLEAYGGARPADADRLLEPVMAELARAGFPAPREVGRRVGEQLSRSGRQLSPDELTTAMRAIESGYKKFVGGQYAEAVTEIDRGLRPLQASPATIAGKQDRRELVLKGLIGLSLAHKRLGRQAEATAAMAELLRSFPDKEISYKDYGPEPRDFFKQVQGDLAREGRGSLAVDVDDDRAVVFVNERYAGVGDVTVSDLYPGAYRVFVQQGDELGRVHDVKVEAGATANVSVSWALDAALESDGAAALVFADEDARRELEPRHAVRVARALGAPSVVVLGIRDNRGRRSVVGAVYTADSTRPLRSGAVAVEPVAPSASRLEALARLLAGDEVAADLVAPLNEESGEAAKDDGGGGGGGGGARPFRAWKWVATGAGALAIAGGVVLIAVHEPEYMDDGSRNPSARATRTAGIITASAGAAVAALGIYFFIRDRSDAAEADTAVSVAPAGDDGAALVLFGSF